MALRKKYILIISSKRSFRPISTSKIIFNLLWILKDYFVENFLWGITYGLKVLKT
jgi:peptidoglycan biosynthesis protein MviN/MurJ (putative lipid II flippase)